MVKIDPKAGMWTIDNTLLPQLRMHALELLSKKEMKGEFFDETTFKAVDIIVHYCLTGEHQLPEKKE